MKRVMTRKQVMLVVTVGIGAGILVAATMTALDWRLNPGGIFYDEKGTSWRVVLATARSWFLPVTLAVSAILAALIVLFGRAR